MNKVLRFAEKFILNHLWIGWILFGCIAIDQVFSNICVSIIFIILFCIVKIIEDKAKPRLKKMESELEKCQTQIDLMPELVRDLFDGYLYNLASDKLGFGKCCINNERISLYIHDSDTNAFTLCGRYSANPDYGSRGRVSYPDSKGCIAKGWQNGWYFDDQFPCPETKYKDYVNYCSKHYGIQKGICRALKMKSRVFAVLRIENKGDFIAVIVLESTEPKRFLKDQQVKLILKKQNDFLAETIHNFESFIPKPSNIKTKGL